MAKRLCVRGAQATDTAVQCPLGATGVGPTSAAAPGGSRSQSRAPLVQVAWQFAQLWRFLWWDEYATLRRTCKSCHAAATLRRHAAVATFRRRRAPDSWDNGHSPLRNLKWFFQVQVQRSRGQGHGEPPLFRFPCVATKLRGVDTLRALRIEWFPPPRGKDAQLDVELLATLTQLRHLHVVAATTHVLQGTLSLDSLHHLETVYLKPVDPEQLRLAASVHTVRLSSPNTLGQDAAQRLSGPSVTVLDVSDCPVAPETVPWLIGAGQLRTLKFHTLPGALWPRPAARADTGQYQGRPTDHLTDLSIEANGALGAWPLHSTLRHLDLRGGLATCWSEELAKAQPCPAALLTCWPTMLGVRCDQVIRWLAGGRSAHSLTALKLTFSSYAAANLGCLSMLLALERLYISGLTAPLPRLPSLTDLALGNQDAKFQDRLDSLGTVAPRLRVLHLPRMSTDLSVHPVSLLPHLHCLSLGGPSDTGTDWTAHLDVLFGCTCTCPRTRDAHLPKLRLLQVGPMRKVDHGAWFAGTETRRITVSTLRLDAWSTRSPAYT